MNMWIIEDYDGVCKACATKEIALREVLQMLRKLYKENPNDEQELNDYRKLMEEYFSPPYREGFHVAEFCWVSKVEFINE